MRSLEGRRAGAGVVAGIPWASSLLAAAHYVAASNGSTSGFLHDFSKVVAVTTRFGDFHLDVDTRELRRGATTLHLSPKAFDLLAILLEQRPRVVVKETLRERLWGGITVLDANLNNLVSEIRAVLDDDAQQPRFVRTAHRVGYAFCGTAVDDARTAASEAARCWLVWNDRTLVIEGAKVVVGRDPKCDLWIDAPGVSRRHAAIRVTAAGPSLAAAIEDLGSTNGTFVEGRRLKRPAALADGQTIGLGEATLTFRTWSSVEAPTKRIRRTSRG